LNKAACHDQRSAIAFGAASRVVGVHLPEPARSLAARHELLAERVAIPANEESPMIRGHRLEDAAIARFRTKTRKKVKNELVIWHRDEDERIAVSPDGTIGRSEAVEVKCLKQLMPAPILSNQ
jgi:hypothetical protein